jgi:hypothetical protein
MATFTIEIDCGSAVFTDRHGEFAPEPELAYILVELATKTMADMMLRPRKLVPLRDSNGNLVGQAKLTTDKPGKETT